LLFYEDDELARLCAGPFGHDLGIQDGSKSVLDVTAAVVLGSSKY
jgi:hypothetical protein